MTLALIVYLINTIGTIKTFLTIVIIVSAVALFISSACRLGRDDYSFHYKDREQTILKDDIAQFRKLIDKSIKYSFVTLVVVSVLQAFTPNERTAWLMVGAYAGQKVAENEKVQELSGKVLTIIERKIDEYIAEPGKQK